MNFDDETDFKYISGDLDKIVIGNDIMPLRDSNHAKDIRGMDVAFLMEAAEERKLARQLTLSNNQALNFSNKISLQQAQQLEQKIGAVAANGDLSTVDSVWYQGHPVELFKCPLMTSYPSWLHQYAGENGLSLYTIPSGTAIDSTLDSQPIQGMFRIVSQMKYIMRKQFVVWGNLPIPDNRWVHQHAGNLDSEQRVQDLISFANPYRAQYARAAWGTGANQAYYTLDISQTTPNYIPDIPQCQSAGNWAGREVYGMFWTYEGISDNYDHWSSWYYHFLKVSDNNGNVTANTLNGAISRIKTLGGSPWNFDMPPSYLHSNNSMYSSHIYYNSFFIFDTMSDRTRWV